MADINKENIVLMESQRLDDTDQGGGQMTAKPVTDGQVNNLFPDISRLDRVYGRVSMRKAYLAVQTSARETYYGSHTIITEQAEDENVSVCFFSSEDWFDTRDEARDRIESYLVRGPLARLSLWGTHYVGTSVLSFLSTPSNTSPEVGDVLVLKDDYNEQYVRIVDIDEGTQSFANGDGDTFSMNVLSITIGNALEEDYVGIEVKEVLTSTEDDTLIYTTVAADASKYYGVASLLEDVSEGSYQVRVDDIMTNLVPSAASETAIVDAGVGFSTSPLIQTKEDATISRQLTFSIFGGAKLFIGEGIQLGSLNWNSPGLSLTDDKNGNVLNGSVNVGAIAYGTGIITFGDPGITTSGTGTISYIPACSPQQISQTGAISIDTANRGFVYTFNCNPIPEPGTLKVEYMSAGKWYTMWDQGSGKISGLDGYEVGSGTLSFITGSVSITLKASPDVDSKILFFWAKPSEYYDFSGESLSLGYKFNTANPSVARNTFEMTWLGNGSGPGENGEYCIVDNGIADLTVATWDESLGWEATGEVVGEIKYATGEIETLIGSGQTTPKANEVFSLKYNYGEPENVTIELPPRNVDGTITFDLDNTPIIPGTFRIEWHTDIVIYDIETTIDETKDPAYVFRDDGAGKFKDDEDDGTTNWVQGVVDYSTGIVTFMPDRTSVFPNMNYEWKETAWLHPGVESSYIFTGITYIPTASIFPPERDIFVSYCTVDGTNQDTYSGTLEPIYAVKEESGLEISPGGLSVSDGSTYMVDGTDGKLYSHVDGVAGNRTQVGTINYANKTFSITSDSINLRTITVKTCVGTATIDPTMSLVFRSPGSPIRQGSVFLKATNSQGETIEGSAGFDGVIVGDGITGQVDHTTGLCHVIFGVWVADDEASQAASWYNVEATDGNGNVWKPYSVSASTILMNAVVTSYLPLDSDLLGLDPVRLPLDGKVPIFRDGYIIVIHDSVEKEMTTLGTTSPLTQNITASVGRTKVDLIEAYAMPTKAQITDGTQTVASLISETDNWTYDLELGEITFLSGFVRPVDDAGDQRDIYVLSRIEDMCLASDVQITGHIAITSPLLHSYTAGKALVSSVLPSADLQSRAYNEFEQSSWNYIWSDFLVGVEPLASYNFVDYPITVTNKPSISEKWLILFSSSDTISIIGENFGVLAEDMSIVDGSTETTPAIIIDGEYCIAVKNKQFTDEYYFVMRCDGFGVGGWQSGNCIRFNQDAANYPLWFVRTTLQAPPKISTDHYTIQIRGDSS